MRYPFRRVSFKGMEVQTGFWRLERRQFLPNSLADRECPKCRHSYLS